MIGYCGYWIHHRCLFSEPYFSLQRDKRLFFYRSIGICLVQFHRKWNIHCHDELRSIITDLILMVQKAVKIQTKQTIRANLTLELTHMNTSHKSIYLQTRSAVLVSAAFGVHRPVTIDVRRFFRDKAGEPPSRKTACSSLCVIAIPPHQFSSTQLCPSKFKEKTSNEKNSVRHMMNTNKELP